MAEVKILYFAWLRDRVGTAEETVSLPPDVRDVAALRDWLAARSPRHTAAFAQGKLIRCAVNQDISGPEHAVAAGRRDRLLPTR